MRSFCDRRDANGQWRPSVKKLKEKKQKISLKKNRRKERTKKTNRRTDSKRDGRKINPQHNK